MRRIFFIVLCLIYSQLLSAATTHKTPPFEWIKIAQVKDLAAAAKIMQTHQYKYAPIFPEQIATQSTPLFATATPEQHTIWLVFGSKSQCYAHVCMMGSIHYEKDKNPTMQYDSHDKLLTQKVMLTGGVPAFFTPAHDLGDSFPTTLSWRCKDDFFRMEWNLAQKSEKKDIMKMANSMVKQMLPCTRPDQTRPDQNKY